jgi:uncharacterized membrane protein
MPSDRMSERGSVLLLFPAAFMIVLVLGALAIDAGAVFLRQRDLAAAAGAAANDAATLGIDRHRLRTDGEVWLDPILVEAAVQSALASRGALDGLLEPPRVAVVDGRRVEVTLMAHGAYVIAPALPGNLDGRIVRVTIGADAVIDDR